MLKITNVKTFIVDGGFRPWTFVKIETSDGTVGWGDCTDWGTPQPVVAMVERMAEAIIGRDPMQAEAIEEAELKLKRSYASKLEKALPEMKVARYLQIENKIRSIIKYELAAEIPLVE